MISVELATALRAAAVAWQPQRGDAFASLEQAGGPVGGYVVTLADGSRHVDVDAARACGRALLSRPPRHLAGPVE